MDLFDVQPIGDSFSTPPKISQVTVADLDRDGLLDVLVCDCVKNTVSWIRQNPAGEFQEMLIAEDVPAPARVECVDLDGDGDFDLAVAVLGQLYPTNDKIGSLLVLEHQPEHVFVRHTLLENVARVSDVRAGDIDSDGDLDLAVTQFGYDDGCFGWMRNDGDWKFEHIVLQSLPGGIHGILQDMNGDSHLDVVVLISQQYERVYIFEGNGQGDFAEKLIYQADSDQFGSSGLTVADLDQDGWPDILYTNGDSFDYSPPHPWPWHGIQWFKNQGNGEYQYQRLTDLGGAVFAQAIDIDQDGDQDILAASTFNSWEDPEAQSLILLENQGDMTFVEHGLANSPTHIQSVAIADLNADGLPDLVTGGMHVFEPYDRVQRVQLWLKRPRPDILVQ